MKAHPQKKMPRIKRGIQVLLVARGVLFSAPESAHVFTRQNVNK